MIQKLSIILISLLLLNTAMAQNLTGVKICINPGHGGFNADDRNVVIAPYTSGDPNGFWESVSNLDKGLALRDMLEAAGATVIMTRVLNRTEDDLPLSQIVAIGNQASVDFMLSIHSNAGNGVANNVLMRVVEPIEIRFKASAVAQTDKTVVDNFENMNFGFDDTKSVNSNNSSAAKNTSRKLFETASGLFRYNFLMSNAHAHYTLATPADGFNSNKVVGLHVYGDLSGNTLQLELTSGTDVRYVNLCNNNFFGWEFHEAKLEQLAVNTNYQLTAVRIVRNVGMLSATGELYLDNMLLYDTPISSTRDLYFANASIFPNPAKHFVQVNGVSDSNMQLKLYSVNGAMLQQSKGNIMLLNNIKAGTYVLMITSKNKTYAQPLIVVK